MEKEQFILDKWFDKRIKSVEHIYNNIGEQHILCFKNGYNASIVRNKYSYGGENGQFELALIRKNYDGWVPEYDKGWFTDVIGWLTNAEVNKYLKHITRKRAKK